MQDKIMRGLETKETTTQMLENYRIYYNFLRRNQALCGKTPAEMTGINLSLGDNKWKGLLKQAIE